MAPPTNQARIDELEKAVVALAEATATELTSIKTAIEKTASNIRTELREPLELPALKVMKMSPTVELPAPAHDGDAGLDIRAHFFGGPNMVIAPFARAVVTTGLQVEIPEGYMGLLLPRSGLALQHGITLANAPGLIDSGYRGQIKLILANLNNERFVVSEGMRLAQLVLAGYGPMPVVEVEELSFTKRGEGGFGSSGQA